MNPMRTVLTGLAWDIGLPVATYYVLHLLGATDWVALLAAAGVAAARIGWVALRRRTLNQFASVMLLVYGLSFALALVTGDPRTLLLKNSLVTAGVAAVFLVTAARGRRPLTLTAMQSVDPEAGARLAERYRTDPDVRRGVRFTSFVWGGGLLAEAIVRVPMVYLLPVEVAVGATEALLVVTLVGLGAWNAWYLRRVRARI